MNKNIYLDYAASTPIKKEVIDEMMPFLIYNYGNASSMHKHGREMLKSLESSRRKIASLINAKKEEIYFTSGGTESDNWALKGIAYVYRNKGKHIITTKIEHPAILNTCKKLEEDGFEITYLDVDEKGFIDINNLIAAIKNDTILVSVMYINNEIGTIQDIKKIGEICRKNNIIFHTDAVQALGQIEIDVEDLNIDLMSISAHKIYGPIGIGVLYKKRGVKIKKLIEGGAQERNKRAGTNNVSGAVGFSRALELSINNLEIHQKKLLKLRNHLMDGIKNNILDIKINGDIKLRHPGNVNVSFKGVKGETLLMNMDLMGISCSSGSACSSGSLEPSHVLLAIGLDKKMADGSLRLTIGDFTTIEEIDYVINKLIEIINNIRSNNE